MLIEIAGVDGSGKSTLSAALRARLDSQGHRSIEVKLRSTSKRVLDDVARDAGQRTWRDLFTAQEVETANAIEMLGQVNLAVAPLVESCTVLTDTYVARWLATAARHGCEDLERLARIYARFPVPDAAFRLDLPPQDAYERLSVRPQGDRLIADKSVALDALNRYASAFLQTAALLPYPQSCLDASRPTHEILGQVLDIISSIGLDCPWAANRSNQAIGVKGTG